MPGVLRQCPNQEASRVLPAWVFHQWYQEHQWPSLTADSQPHHELPHENFWELGPGRLNFNKHWPLR